MEAPKKILILTYYWPPSGGSGVQRWMYFAYYLKQFGHEPVIVTVDEKYASYKFIDRDFEKKVSHIRSIRTPSREPFAIYSSLIGASREEAIPLGFSGESNPGLIKKISRFIRGNLFIPDARIGWIHPTVKHGRTLLKKERFDCMVSTGPPHSAHLAAWKLHREFRIPWIADFRDPWTELYYNKMLYRTRAAERYDARLEKKILESSDLVLTVGPSMKELLQRKLNGNSGKVHFIYNGYDDASLSKITRSRQDDTFVICHLGILSDNQPITGFLRAAQKVHESDPEVFSRAIIKLVGKISPAILDQIRSMTPFLRMEIIPYVPHQQALQYMMDADLLLNSLADTQESRYLISGKLMEYLATGNPVLCLGNPAGDAARLLGDFTDAKVFDRADVDNMAHFIIKIFRNRGNKQHLPSVREVNKFSRENTARELVSLIEKLTGDRT